MEFKRVVNSHRSSQSEGRIDTSLRIDESHSNALSCNSVPEMESPEVSFTVTRVALAGFSPPTSSRSSGDGGDRNRDCSSTGSYFVAMCARSFSA